jgi:feruloyl esterase
MHRTALLAFALALRASVAAGAGTPCEKLTELTIPDVRIIAASITEPGSLHASSPVTVPRMCRVVAVATPTPQSYINLEVWIPANEQWNGKLLGTPNGGFGGSVPYAAMAAGAMRGYATVGTDTGHSGDQMEFGRNNPEKIVDWAYRSIHVMTTTAKLIVRNHRGRLPQRSYFNGCSTGGHQALSEAQRFPADYDGIVAGAPGNNRKRLIYGFLWSWRALHTEDGKPRLMPDHLNLVARQAVAACDRLDGLHDGLIDDPRRCDFDPGVLLCKGAATDACLTSDQIEAVRTVYRGASRPKSGEQIFVGWPRGSEAGWRQYLLAPPEPMRLGLFKDFGFHDPNWDWRTFDWDRDIDYLDAQLPHLDATSVDLRAFQARGGKIIMYAGWADPVVPAADTINYFEAVARDMGGLAAVQDFFRLWLVPGMGHCGGEVSLDSFAALTALEQWVEEGRRPQGLISEQRLKDRIVRTRPLCAYPEVARHSGAGNSDDAGNFTCRVEAPARVR